MLKMFEDIYKCDPSLRGVHKRCAEAKCMTLQKRVLLLICEDCKEWLARMLFMVKMINEMKKDIENLKSEMQKDIQDFKSELKPPLMRESYAGVLQSDQNSKPEIKMS